MDSTLEAYKQKLIDAVDERQGKFVDLLRNLIQIPNDNPLRDTLALTYFLEGYISERGIEPRIYESREGNVARVFLTFDRTSFTGKLSP